MVTSDVDKAQLLSEYFSSVFVTDNGILPEFDPDCRDELNKFSCNVRDVVKVVLNMKSNSSPGPDGIPANFIKNVISHVANPLCKVFNLLLEEGVVPDEWKVAHIVPIFKKGDTQLASQYRPVSLTSVYSKILERVIRPQLLDYMIRNNIIPKEQHGFYLGSPLSQIYWNV